MAAPIGEDLVLVSGVSDAMPGVVPVLLNGDPAMSMTASVFTWTRNGASAEAAIGFIAVIPVKVAGRVRVRSVVMRRKGQQPVRYTLIRRALSLETFMSMTSRDAGPEFSGVADGVANALLKGGASSKRLAAMLAMLSAAALNDGFVEVMGTLDTGEVFLQGWSSGLPSDRVHLLASHGQLSMGEFRSAAVQRDDLGGRGHGFVGILDTGGALVDTRGLKRLFFRGGQGWLALDIYDRCTHLAPTDVPAHIRDAIPRANASSETLMTLRRAGERFDGRDTVSTLKQPVRIGMDMVLELPKGGMLVCGWMLDPDNLVQSVKLHAGKESVAIDGIWTRLARPDVTAAFQQDAAFAQRLDPQQNDHGFMAFVPKLSAANDCAVYFEFSLDDETAFYPLKAVKSSSRRTLDRVITVLDPRSAAAASAIEAHVGPMLQALDHQKPRVVEHRDFGYDESAVLTGLVVGGGFESEEILTTLVLLALDPDTRDLPMILSVPAEVFGKIALEVQRLASFYRLGIRLVSADGVQDACDAWDAAVHATECETLALLSAGALPRLHGWFSVMERAYRARAGKVLVSPTVVFEDNSISFAGTLLDQRERRLVDSFLGYPCDVIRGAEPIEVMAGSPACCLVSRAAFQDVGGFSQSYLSIKEKVRDLCLKLRLAGTPSLWLPEVEMIAADVVPADANLPRTRLTQRIDHWSFDRRWSLLVSNMRGTE
ncbi:glycosyltransferase family 2 protein [Microvirga terricola]|uniref:glycosyltransferase family 2 protein n=1 Tax=Microvirga terricola TaxID=2719797 RepID=UPI00197BC658|nr:hypothetical protein [Microvirga terricola]